MSRVRSIATLVVALSIATGITWVTVNRFPMSSTLYAQAQVYEPDSGVSLPFVLSEVKPAYTREAMEAKIQGSVFLSIVVTESGDVTGITVTRSLDATYGLDQAAVAAAEQWKFRPGMKDGKPVPVRVTLELTFTLK
jgi:TonB family protein